jgi:hypothetical protein
MKMFQSDNEKPFRRQEQKQIMGHCEKRKREGQSRLLIAEAQFTVAEEQRGKLGMGLYAI